MEINVKFSSVEEMMDFMEMFDRVREDKEVPKADAVEENQDTGNTEKTAYGQQIAEHFPNANVTEEKEDSKEHENYSLEEVRAKLAELNKSGKRDEVKGLIASFGAGKLTDIAPGQYTELMKKAGEL